MGQIQSWVAQQQPHSQDGLTLMPESSCRLAEASLQEMFYPPAGRPELIYVVAERLSAAREGKPQRATTSKTSAGITFTGFLLV